MSLSEFIQQAKWAIQWMNGYSFVPSLLQRTYLIFTDSRLILYCPCNTYYTTYRLQGDTLTDLSWSGTKNQCSDSQDELITNLVFYSKIIKQQGQLLAFYYSQQIKMTEFQPFF
jgi:heat shock protein HslJ